MYCTIHDFAMVAEIFDSVFHMLELLSLLARFVRISPSSLLMTALENHLFLLYIVSMGYRLSSTLPCMAHNDHPAKISLSTPESDLSRCPLVCQTIGLLQIILVTFNHSRARTPSPSLRSIKNAKALPVSSRNRWGLLRLTELICSKV